MLVATSATEAVALVAAIDEFEEATGVEVAADEVAADVVGLMDAVI